MDKRRTIVILLVFSLAAIILSMALLQPNPLTDNQNQTQNTPDASPTITPYTTPTVSPKPTKTPPSTTPTPPLPTAIPTPAPITPPQSATIIFSDGFQSENTNAWTNMHANSVTLSIENSVLKCSTSGGSSNNWGYIYKWLNQTYGSLNWRWYVCFANLPSTDGNVVGAGGIYNSAVEDDFSAANSVCAVNIVNRNGVCYWQLDYTDNKTFRQVVSTSAVAANTWYLVELQVSQGDGNGEVHFNLNNIKTLSATGLHNNYAGIDHVSVGGGITANNSVTWYCDGAVASQTP